MLSDFCITHMIGQGAFGKVYLGELQASNEQFAIKSMRKDRLVQNSNLPQSVFLELQILVQTKHPFLASL